MNHLGCKILEPCCLGTQKLFYTHVYCSYREGYSLPLTTDIQGHFVLVLSMNRNKVIVFCIKVPATVVENVSLGFFKHTSKVSL